MSLRFKKNLKSEKRLQLGTLAPVGLILFLVQNLDPCECDCEDCGYFFRSVTVWVVSAITVFAATVVAFHYFHFGRRNEYEEPVQNQYDNLDDILDG